MKLSEFKKILPNLTEIHFRLENGIQIPTHFHLTELGQITKNFIDCGGVIRTEKKVSFQLWFAHDISHRLSVDKLLHIISLAEDKLQIEDAEIEAEYQTESISKYTLTFDGENFILQNTFTACLAEDACDIPDQKKKVNLVSLPLASNSCTPGSGCC